MTINTQSAFQIRILPEAELRLALPIAQLLYPSLSETEWVAYASGRPPPAPWAPRRVLTAFNPVGYLHGLCTLADGIDPRCGRTLDVDDLVIANFVDPHSVPRAMLSGIEEIARNGGYHAVRVILADGNLLHRQAMVDTLNSVGHVQTMARYAKLLSPPLSRHSPDYLWQERKH